MSLAILAATAAAQAAIYVATGSIALLADLVHNAGDALTAVPLGAAFLLRSPRAERAAGYLVVLTILASAVIAGALAIDRIVHPLAPDHLLALAVAGAAGAAGNAIAARVRLGGGRRLDSPALIADGEHARSDAIVSIGVVLSARVRRARGAGRRPDHRPRDQRADPPHHVGELDDDAGGPPRPRAPRRPPGRHLTTCRRR